MNLSTNQVVILLKRQCPEQRASLLACSRDLEIGLNNLRLERFLADPSPATIEDFHYEFLEDWFAGHFGFSSHKAGWIRINVTTAPAVMLGVRPEAFNGKRISFKVGGGNTMGATMPATNKAKDLPSPNEAKLAAAKRRDEERAEAAKNKKPSVVQQLMTFGRSPGG